MLRLQIKDLEGGSKSGSKSGKELPGLYIISFLNLVKRNGSDGDQKQPIKSEGLV